MEHQFGTLGAAIMADVASRGRVVVDQIAGAVAVFATKPARVPKRCVKSCATKCSASYAALGLATREDLAALEATFGTHGAALELTVAAAVASEPKPGNSSTAND